MKTAANKGFSRGRILVALVVLLASQLAAGVSAGALVRRDTEHEEEVTEVVVEVSAKEAQTSTTSKPIQERSAKFTIVKKDLTGNGDASDQESAKASGDAQDTDATAATPDGETTIVETTEEELIDEEGSSRSELAAAPTTDHEQQEGAAASDESRSADVEAEEGASRAYAPALGKSSAGEEQEETLEAAEHSWRAEVCRPHESLPATTKCSI